MKASDIKVIREPCTKTFSELIEEFRNIDKEELYETFNCLRKIKNASNYISRTY